MLDIASICKLVSSCRIIFIYNHHKLKMIETKYKDINTRLEIFLLTYLFTYIDKLARIRRKSSGKQS